MIVNISRRLSRDKEKIWYSLESDRAAGQRKATHIFTYTKPANRLQKEFNQKQLQILATRQAKLALSISDQQFGNCIMRTPQNQPLDYLDYNVKCNEINGNQVQKKSFSRTEEEKEADELVRQMSIAFEMVKVKTSPRIVWLITQTVKKIAERKGNFDLFDSVLLTSKSKVFFPEDDKWFL
jgi:hypothetical protein